MQGVARAALVLAGTLGLTISDDVSGQVLAAIAATYALVEVTSTLWARARVTPSAKIDGPPADDYPTD